MRSFFSILGIVSAAWLWSNSIQAAPDRAFDRAIHEWQLPIAISKLNPGAVGLEAERKKGIVAFHRGDYATATRALRAALAIQDSETKTAIQAMLDKAIAAQALFGEKKAQPSKSGRVSVVFANPKDELLAPYFFDAIQKAQPKLAQAIGPIPSVPARFEFIQTPADLAKLTNLPLDAVYKTGTIGITKYHRVMMASPRITLTGYEWLDTAVHEYVHFLVSIRTRNRTPVWLHEGLAKFFETCWRQDKPRQISKTQASLLDEAFKNNKLITLEQMHPSIALLPSQSDAALAYAQVQTMIAFLQRTRGAAAISTVLEQVAEGKDAAQAFGHSYKKGWDRFYADWKKDTAMRVARMQKKRFVPQRFKKEGRELADLRDPGPDVFSRLEAGAARKHARLATLLAQRGHEAQAITQFERALAAAPKIAKDPKLARRLGQLYLDQDQGKKAWQYLDTAAQDEPDDAYLAMLVAKAALARGRKDLALAAANRALAQNPMIPELHCVLGELYTQAPRIAHELKYCGLSEDEQ